MRSESVIDKKAQNQAERIGKPFKVYSRRPKGQAKGKGIFGSLIVIIVVESKEKETPVNN